MHGQLLPDRPGWLRLLHQPGTLGLQPDRVVELHEILRDRVGGGLEGTLASALVAAGCGGRRGGGGGTWVIASAPTDSVFFLWSALLRCSQFMLGRHVTP